MKSKFWILVINMIFFSSCETLGGLDNVEIDGRIPVEQAYENEGVIEAAIIGAYASIRNMIPMPAVLSGSGLSGQLSVRDFGLGATFVNHTVRSNNIAISDIYGGGYRALANANELIIRLPKTGEEVLSEAKRNFYLGEAKFMRALSYFYMLRVYGEFYNQNSEYGIVLGPIEYDENNNPIPQKRATVKESYRFILEDINDVLNSGIPNSGDASRATIKAAKALKMKVLLYMRRYDEVVEIGKEFVGSELESKYENIYVRGHTGVDIIFATPTDFVFSNYEGGGYTEGIIPGSVFLNTLQKKEGDWNRISRTLPSDTHQTGFKWAFTYPNPPAWMHLRIPEVLLIYAEAKARVVKAASGTIEELSVEVSELNRIRERAGVVPKQPENINEFLKIIRLEKLMELYYENGEDWFDLVRYHIEEDLNIFLIKDKLDSKENFVYPIPEEEIMIGGGIIVQNPGYE
ncbi:RagB/SusD family nutrient uptake outer membrane protein [Aquimarina hainanensis]|uniref:RagB/SusD family nutrient uptake outer membrane protein n=1 Tax=Aquimarina hainanensis TaxID=1578017 RepID=A0ABW5N3D4_9FLAO|nr:RagB/SusD family nutrient uptake outer membrane protein [Aquimarina sp. TRL1]QKX04266.1 RagB/SusD family nutrient uptake outer membrane protein [Aquimarina sp. TRL1]